MDEDKVRAAEMAKLAQLLRARQQTAVRPDWSLISIGVCLISLVCCAAQDNLQNLEAQVSHSLQLSRIDRSH